MKKLRGKVVVITGASSGVGKAAALQFADQRASLVLAARREDPLQQLADECKDRGAQVEICAVDTSVEAEVQGVVDTVLERFGRIDVWVNNAAVISYGPLEETPGEWWRRVVEVNLFGYFHAARAVIPVFREQGGGTLINVGSILSRTVIPYQSAYVASKHAIYSMSESIRQESKDLPELKVCDVLPGAIDTPLFKVAANVSGKEPVPPLEPANAREVAQAIVKCARKPVREMVVGASNKLTVKSYDTARRATGKVLTAMTERQHFTDEPRERTEGNLYQGADGHADIDGGYLDEHDVAGQYESQKSMMRRAMSVMVFTGIAAGLGAALKARQR